MPDRRGRRVSMEDLLPEDGTPWAREIWADRHEVAKKAATQGGTSDFLSILNS